MKGSYQTGTPSTRSPGPIDRRVLPVFPFPLIRYIKMYAFIIDRRMHSHITLDFLQNSNIGPPLAKRSRHPRETPARPALGGSRKGGVLGGENHSGKIFFRSKNTLFLGSLFSQIARPGIHPDRDRSLKKNTTRHKTITE